MVLNLRKEHIALLAKIVWLLIFFGLFAYETGAQSFIRADEIDDEIGFTLIPSNQEFGPEGSNDRRGFGKSVDIIGDINGDGYDDIAIGISFGAAHPSNTGNSNIHAGNVLIIYGNENMMSGNLSTADFSVAEKTIINGWESQDALGTSVSKAGDFNNDGFDDFIIGSTFDGRAFSPGSSTLSSVGPGAAFIVYGSAENLPSIIDLSQSVAGIATKIVGAGYHNRLGECVNMAGDVNGDGIDDVIVGSMFGDAEGVSAAGNAHVIFGTENPTDTLFVSDLNGENGFTISGTSDLRRVGRSVNAAGDLNSDGFGDLIVTQERASYPNRGFIVFGGNNLSPRILVDQLNGQNGFSVGENAETRSELNTSSSEPFAVSTVGDANGDGYDDALIVYGFSGLAYYIFGRQANTPFPSRYDLDSLGARLQLPNERFKFLDSDFSESISIAGDINGDGLTDLILGGEDVPRAQNGRGKVFVLYGTEDTPRFQNLKLISGKAGFTILPAFNSADFGTAAGGGGDINGDGLADFLISDPNASNINGTFGKVYVIYGSEDQSPILDAPFIGRIIENQEDLVINLDTVFSAFSKIDYSIFFRGGNIENAQYEIADNIFRLSNPLHEIGFISLTIQAKSISSPKVTSWNFSVRYREPGMISYYSSNTGFIVDALAFNSPSIIKAKVAEDRFENQNAAMLFDTTGAYVRINEEIISLERDYTVSCWFNPATETAQDFRILWSSRLSGDGRRNVGIEASLLTDGELSVTAYTSSGRFSPGDPLFTISSDSPVKDNEWNHMSFVKSGDTYELFLNGSSMGTRFIDANEFLSPAQFWTFGAMSDADHTPIIRREFEGKIDDVAFYALARTRDQIVQEYEDFLRTTQQVTKIGSLPDRELLEDVGTVLLADLDTVFTTDSDLGIVFTVFDDFGNNGTIEVDEDNVLSLTPNDDYFGSHQVTIVPSRLDKADTFSVSITSVNDLPTLVATTTRQFLRIDRDSLVINLNEIFVDKDGDVLTYTLRSNSNPSISDLFIRADPDRLVLIPNVLGESNLSLEAQDPEGEQAIYDFTLLVIPPNDPPVITPDQTFIVDENEVTEIVIGRVLATDLEGDAMIFSMPDTDSNSPFTIDTSGFISTISQNPLDYETQRTYRLLIEVADSLSASRGTVTIAVNDLNDPPVLKSAISLAINENTPAKTIIVNLDSLVTDQDGDPVTVAITNGNTDGVFDVVGNTLQLEVQDASILDFETNPQFNLVVELSDLKSLTTWNVVINLLDVNEAPTLDDRSFSITPDVGDGFIIGTITGMDEDEDLLSYSISSGNESGAFELNEQTGQLIVRDRNAVNFEIGDSYTLDINVDDGEFQILAIVTVNVEELLSVENLEATLVRLFPNPSINQLILEIHSKPIDHIETYTMDGKLLSIPVENINKEWIMDVSNLSPGPYIIEIHLDNRVLKKKFIKE